MRKVSVLGMDLDEWSHQSCTAHFGTGDNWATLYDIESKNQNKGHAQQLLLKAISYYHPIKISGTIALNPIMKHIYNKLGIGVT